MHNLWVSAEKAAGALILLCEGFPWMMMLLRRKTDHAVIESKDACELC